MNEDADSRDAPPAASSPPTAADAHEARAALLTAYALGQLDAAERTAVEPLLADPAQADARALVADAAALAAALRSGRETGLPPRSPGLRRAVVARLAAGAAPAMPTAMQATAAHRRSRWLAALAAVAASMLIVGMVVSPLWRIREPAREIAMVTLDSPAELDAVLPPAAGSPSPPPAALARAAVPADQQRSAAARSEGGFGGGGGGGGRGTALPEVNRNAIAAAQAPAQRKAGPAGEPPDRGGDAADGNLAPVRTLRSVDGLPATRANRIDDLLNSFVYADPAPTGDEPFSVRLEAATCPWRRGSRLVRVGVRGQADTPAVPGVTIDVAFNPTLVAAHRRLGGDDAPLVRTGGGKALAQAAASESWQATTVVYEITLVDEAQPRLAATRSLVKPAEHDGKPGESRTTSPAVDSRGTEILRVRLLHTQPTGEVRVLREVPLVDRGGDFATASADLRFAAAVAGFGMIMNDDPDRGSLTLSDVAAIAAAALGPDSTRGFRMAFLEQVRNTAAKAGPAGDR